jgi:glutamine---fructose-6-phosphate transaminase (isomerizing)
MADAPDAPRTGHPYHMHDAILAQPDAFVASIQQNGDALDRVAQRTATCERLFLVGIGTSYHAAQIGEHLLRAYAPGVDARAVHAFDFALVGPPLRPTDAVLVISHRGNKRYSVAALGRAHAAGCWTALVTGAGASAETSDADLVLRTTANERSSAHTISYTAAIALLAALAVRLGALEQAGSSPLPASYLSETLPSLLRQALLAEPQMEKLAREYMGRRRIWLAGAGPSGVTAQEIALKIKETSYVQAEGMSTETMLHGPFQASEADDLFCLIAPSGPGQERTLTLLQQVGAIGAAALVVGDGTLQGQGMPATSAICTVPEVPEPLCALTCLIPLQLFAYWLAIARGTDPDGFRLEDPRYNRARQLVRL